MYDFVSHILRRYFEATGWNEYNSYLNLTASSSSILDFHIPSGFSLSISASPTPAFFTSYRLAALPTLRGGIGYIYSSTDTPLDFGRSSKDVRFKDLVERFRIVQAPTRPEGKEQVWLAGERVDTRDYLIYACMHVPSSRLDALYTTRLSPTWQFILTAVSTPPRYPLSALQNSVSLAGDKSLDASQTQPAAPPITPGAGPPGSTNLQLTLQRDTGRWFTEYSYSADDALWGFRVLHNFGGTPEHVAPRPVEDQPSQAQGHGMGVAAGAGVGPNTSLETPVHADRGRWLKRINESGLLDEMGVVGGGLRGRFSAGAEVFVSTVEKSAGLSTGIRFATLPDLPGSPPSQPPTIITATLNPMMGHLSTAYAARMSRDVAVCSRFDFNVYSYDSELTFGGEYWLRSSSSSAAKAAASAPALASAAVSVSRLPDPDRRLSLSLREEPPPPPVQETTPAPAPAPAVASVPESAGTVSRTLDQISGVLKARISTTSDVRLLWQGRLRNCLVSLGVKADLNSHLPRQQAGSTAAGTGILKSVGVEVMYFSNAEDAQTAGMVGGAGGRNQQHERAM